MGVAQPTIKSKAAVIVYFVVFSHSLLPFPHPPFPSCLLQDLHYLVTPSLKSRNEAGDLLNERIGSDGVTFKKPASHTHLKVVSAD